MAYIVTIFFINAVFFLRLIHQRILKKYHRLKIYLAAQHHIRMISEGSCD